MAGMVNIPNWLKMSDRVRKQFHRRANIYVRARIKRVFDEAIRVSPQWSGNYAANWTIQTSHRDVGQAVYHKGLKVDPWTNLKWWDTGANDGKVTAVQKAHNAKHEGKWASYAGSAEAIRMAKARTDDAIDTVKWNTNVKLVNMSPVADTIEEGGVKFRQVNMVHGTLGVLTYLKDKYKYLD